MTRTSVAVTTLLVGSTLTLSCTQASQGAAEVELRVAGTAVDGAIEGKDGAIVTLTRADLAFGPLYLCAGAQAGDLCETARLEWLESVVVDALDPAASDAGVLTGVTGPVRSWMFDLGITSLLTEEEPLVLDAAGDLGARSIRLEGEASVEGVVIPFTVALPIQQEEETEQGIPVVRKSTSETFEHEVAVDGDALLITFDPRPWVTQIDFAALLVEEACGPEGPEVTCAGTVEQTCAPNGDIAETRDCADDGALCLRGIGCAETLEFAEGSQGQKAVRDQVVAGPRPRFDWN